MKILITSLSLQVNEAIGFNLVGLEGMSLTASKGEATGPSTTVEFSDQVVGAGYKFRDYLACFGIDDPTPVEVTSAPDYQVALSRPWEAHERPGLDDLITGLIEAFPDLD